MNTIEQRLADLEVRLTFIDDTVQALAAADAEQAMRIVELERLLHLLRQELQSVRLGPAHDPHNEPPPPHY
jgi:SlyX protein